jgi:hypothetical protein
MIFAGRMGNGFFYTLWLRNNERGSSMAQEEVIIDEQEKECIPILSFRF